MKKYITTGLFSSWAAYLICHISMSFPFWSYSDKLEEIFIDGLIVPVLAMLWVRYAPSSTLWLIAWNLLWTLPLTGLEYLGERYSSVIKYHNGYDWYHSLALWFISWFVWYAFHKWFTRDTSTARLSPGPYIH
jgi:hypothetical protein